MPAKMQITPKFNVREIMQDTLGKFWFEFQLQAFALGKKTQHYMRHYINNNRKRQGGSGNLAKSINFDSKAGSGLGRVEWGVGYIPNLQTRAPYWYVVNYGKTISGKPYVPFHGNFVPGRFSGGDGRPKSEYAGKGVESFIYQPNSGKGMFPKSPIRPINYIQATRHKMNMGLRAILLKLNRR